MLRPAPPKSNIIEGKRREGEKGEKYRPNGEIFPFNLHGGTGSATIVAVPPTIDEIPAWHIPPWVGAHHVSMSFFAANVQMCGRHTPATRAFCIFALCRGPLSLRRAPRASVFYLFGVSSFVGSFLRPLHRINVKQPLIVTATAAADRGTINGPARELISSDG